MTKSDISNAENDNLSNGDIAFENVTFCYHKGGEAALEKITFHAPSGSTVGIIGGTGSGKSSLVNLIPRFYDVSDGSVAVGGKDVRQFSNPEALREQIGIVPQKAELFAGTVRENLQWGSANATDEELMTALTDAQAAAFVMEKEGGLDFMIEQGGRNLSGGQRQRLTIARALVRRPKILILDDSASALDLATDAALRRSISKLEYRPTTVIVSQRTASIKDADLILVLDDGVAVDKGTHEELLSRCAVYREIYNSQFKEVTANE